MIRLKDSGDYDKKGLSDWFNAEVLSSLVFDVQKQAEEILEIMKPLMENKYWRLNPPMDT